MQEQAASQKILHHFLFVGILATWLIFALFSVALSQPGSQNTPTSGPEVVRFGTMQLMPYGMNGSDGKISGFLNEMRSRPPSNEVPPVKRLISGLQSGKYDFPVFAETSFIKKKFPFVEKIRKNLEFGILPAASIRLDSYADPMNIQIVLPLEIRISPAFYSEDTLTKIKAKGYFHAVRMLGKGHIDAIGGALDSLRYNVPLSYLDPKTIFGKPYILEELDVWLVCQSDRLPSQTIERCKTTIALRQIGAIEVNIGNYM